LASLFHHEQSTSSPLELEEGRGFTRSEVWFIPQHYTLMLREEVEDIFNVSRKVMEPMRFQSKFRKISPYGASLNG
jgi:hypothetical protein